MDLRDHTQAVGSTTLVADVVIVGTGPGGAAAARVFAEAGLKVVMLEEGPARPNFRPNLAHVNRYHMQEGGAMVAMGDHFMPVAAGRGVGGGSLVNSALSFRTPDPVLQGWTEVLKDDRYGPDAMRPVFDEVGEIIQIGLTPPDIAGENNLIIARGVEKLGLHGGLAPRNTPRCTGCGFCNYGCPVGGKASMDTNFIPMAMGRGAIVQADTKVDRVLVEGDRAVGVSGRVLHTDTREEVGRIEVRAEKVVLCAGGVGTPRLLHHAGLAKRLGPAVGVGMHVHPGNLVLGECDFDVKMWSGATQGAYFESDDHPGVLPHTATLPPGALLMLFGKVGRRAKEDLQRVPRMCGCVVMISDKGEGWVSANADGTARIGYDFAPNDIQRIKDGMVLTARVLLEGGAKKVMCAVHGVGEHESLASFEAALMPRTIHDFALYASHPMSSCRMGLDPATSVIDVDAQAHGLEGLYISDSSIFPTSLGVNPQYTTMTLSTLIARNIVA
ncbi:MAG: GMC family oxidoreductase [Alphaproteobacteria bacterium]|nr:GMC family oxidoreductase [Alphaproteobacteria bacterium]